MNEMTITIHGTRYMRPRDAASTASVPLATVGNWLRAGALRMVVRRGRAYIAVEDIVYLRTTPAEVTRAEGRYRRTEEELAAIARWVSRAQERTRAQASRAREVWEATEDAACERMATRGVDVTTAALAQGRTYSAEMHRRALLRRAEREAAQA